MASFMNQLFAVILLACLLAARKQLKCRSGINVEHPKFCDKYFSCVAGVIILRGCPQLTAFDTKLRQCVHISQVVCGNRYIDTEDTLEVGIHGTHFQLNPTKTFEETQECEPASHQVACTEFVTHTPTKTLTTTMYTRTVTSYITENP